MVVVLLRGQREARVLLEAAKKTNLQCLSRNPFLYLETENKLFLKNILDSFQIMIVALRKIPNLKNETRERKKKYTQNVTRMLIVAKEISPK